MLCKVRTHLEKLSLVYLISYDIVFLVWIIDIILEFYLPSCGSDQGNSTSPYLLVTFIIDKIADIATLMLYINFNLEISHVKNKLKSEDFNQFQKIEQRFFRSKVFCLIVFIGTQIPIAILCILSFIDLNNYSKFLQALLILKFIYTLFILWFFFSVVVPTISYFSNKKKERKGSQRSLLAGLLYTEAIFTVLS